MLVSMIISCNQTNTDTTTDINSDSQVVDTSDTTDTQKPTDTNNDPPPIIDANGVEYHMVKTNLVDTQGYYYKKVNYYAVSDPNNSSIDDYESYIRIFNSLDELSKYAKTTLTSDIFNTNYVVCIQSVFETASCEDENLIGYYNLKYENREYSITKNYSLSTRNNHLVEQIGRFNFQTDYIIVPKGEIQYVEGTHKLEIEKVQINKETFFYATPTQDISHKGETTSFIVNRELAEKIGLKVSAYEEMSDYNQEILILYMPFQHMSNLAITECEIKDGNLYLTIEKYDEQPEGVALPITPDDEIFYEIYCDTSKLSENYQVFLNYYEVHLPNTPKPENTYQATVEIDYVDFDHALYSEIRSLESTDEEKYFFPEEIGSYFMLINSYEQMLQYFNTNEVTEETFENNYIMVLHRHYESTYYGEREVAFRNLKYENGEYSITLDWFLELGDRAYPEYIQEYFNYNYLVIPKNKIDYIEGIQNITVSYNEIKQSRISLINSKNDYPVPEQNSAFVVNKDSLELYEYGLSKFYFSKADSVLLYLDNVPENEFIVTEVRIVGGNLYLTLHTYNHIDKDYFTSNVNFYNINVDTTQLNERFTVYISIYDWII